MSDSNNIKYLNGDVRSPLSEGNVIIPHICNDLGLWGSGFVLSLSEKWKTPEYAYRIKKDRKLNDVQFVRVENNIIVANMIAQSGVKSISNPKPINYDALTKCLVKVNDMAIQTGSSIHMPKIGSGLAGGDWNTIEKIIMETIIAPVIVYEY